MAREIPRETFADPAFAERWPDPIPEPAEPRAHPAHIPDALGLSWDELAALAELEGRDELGADSEGGEAE